MEGCTNHGKVRIGVIGVGNMGPGHVRAIKNIPEAELVAVCDRIKERADKYAKEAGPQCRAFYSTDELFASGCVDAVTIAIPHYDHCPVTIAAFEHGLHVLCEKPITVTKSMAQKMIDAHARHPELRFGLMFQQRTHQAHRKIKELIEKGEFGRILRVNWIITDWFRTQSYYDSGSWRATWAGEGGGVLLNQCPHNLDLFQWFFGLPVKVRSFLSIGNITTSKSKTTSTPTVSLPTVPPETSSPPPANSPAPTGWKFLAPAAAWSSRKA